MDLDSFAQDGFAYVRGAVSRSVMAALRHQVAAELIAPSIAAESGEVAVALDRPETWPAGEARRVVEVTPPGGGAHWDELVSSPKLVAALDAILGKGAWELPANGLAPENGGRVEVRHWYAPIAFPAHPPPDASNGGGGGNGASSGSSGGKGGGGGEDSEGDVTMAIQAGAGSAGGSAAGQRCGGSIRGEGAPSRHEVIGHAGAGWVPINRRGQRWRGFHLDIGPGFDTDEMRTLRGHPYQGCVVLLLGSDWTAGAPDPCPPRPCFHGGGILRGLSTGLVHTRPQHRSEPPHSSPSPCSPSRLLSVPSPSSLSQAPALLL